MLSEKLLASVFIWNNEIYTNLGCSKYVMDSEHFKEITITFYYKIVIAYGAYRNWLFDLLVFAVDQLMI